MKHSLKITLYITAFFLLSQIIGLFIIDAYIDWEGVKSTGNVEYKELPSIAGISMERPTATPWETILYVGLAILIGTLIILLIIKLKTLFVWKLWFFVAITVCLQVSIAAFIKEYIALGIAIILATLKIWRKSLIIHNITEVLIYGGLAAMFVPILNITYAMILLAALSIYDMYAVWKSKHMVKMANFQTESGIFAGFYIPYKAEKDTRVAVLGGGDIGFPLMFTGVVLNSTILEHGPVPSLIVAGTTTISLFILLMLSRKNKFYPAMPFLTAGCITGYILSVIVQAIIG